MSTSIISAFLAYGILHLRAVSGWAGWLPNTPIQNYLTLIIKSLGFDTFQTNLLSIPAYALFIVQAIFWTWFSEKIKNRMLVVLICQFWMFPIVLALELLPNGSSAWARYVLTMLQYGYPVSKMHPVLNAHHSLTME